MPEVDGLLGAPVIPDRNWLFEVPAWILSLGAGDIHVDTATEVGRAAALYYDHDVCYLNEPGACWKPPASPTGNEVFHAGHIDFNNLSIQASAAPTLDEQFVAVGTIPIFGGHATGEMTLDEAVSYHDEPAWQKLVGTLWDVMLPRSDDPADGARQCGLFLGAGIPELTWGEAMLINRSGLSGEWWPRDNMVTTSGITTSGLDALGPVLVSKAAIPINREGTLERSELPMTASYNRTKQGPVIGPSIIIVQGEPTMATPTIAGKPIQAAVVEPAQCNTCGTALDAATAAPVIGSKAAAPCCDSCATTDAVDEIMPEGTVEDPAGDPPAVGAGIEARMAAMEGRIAQLLAQRAQVSGPRTAGVRAVRAALDGIPYGERRQVLREELEKAHLSDDDDTWDYLWVEDFDESAVIFTHEKEEDGAWVMDTFQQEYTISDDREVSLGADFAVRQEWVVF